MTDDTTAINRAIGAAQSGWTVHFPGGTYLIDATKSIMLRSGVSLDLSDDALLKAKPTAASAYAVVKGIGVSDVTITGGRIAGERFEHKGRGGEHGHGLALIACQDIQVSRMTITDAWGDGIFVGWHDMKLHLTNSRSIRIDNVTVANSRRNALTLDGVERARISNCVFRSSKGTLPEAGVDLEPDAEWTTPRNIDIVLTDCVAQDNAQVGFAVSAVANRNITFLRCKAIDNGEYGFVIDGDSVLLEDCRAGGQSKRGLLFRGTNVQVIGGDYSVDTAPR